MSPNFNPLWTTPQYIVYTSMREEDNMGDLLSARMWKRLLNDMLRIKIMIFNIKVLVHPFHYNFSFNFILIQLPI